MSDIYDILNSPAAFYCERYKCKLLKKRCVERQDRDEEYADPNNANQCRNCKQGKAIREGKAPEPLTSLTIKKEDKEMPRKTEERKCKYCGETDKEKLVKNKKCSEGLENCCYACRATYMRERWAKGKVAIKKPKTSKPLQTKLPETPGKITMQWIEAGSGPFDLSGILDRYPAMISALEKAAKDDIRDVKSYIVATMAKALREGGYLEAA